MEPDGTSGMGFVCHCLGLVLTVAVAALNPVTGDAADYDAHYYPEPNYELEFLDAVNHADPTVHEHHDEYDHEDDAEHHIHDPHPELVKDRWEHRLGDVVEGGYTVQEPDGTVHHVRYTENRRSAAPQGPEGPEHESVPEVEVGVDATDY